MKQRIILPLIIILLSLLGVLGHLNAQTPSIVELVALDKQSQTVKDLNPGDIELRMDGRPVAIESLRLEPKQPPRMLLLIDTSYTVMTNRPLFKDIIAAFIDAKPRRMEMAVATINQLQQFLSPYQTSNDELVSSLQKIKFGGDPPLFQSIVGALQHFQPDISGPSKGARSVMVVFSDGTDLSPSELRESARKALQERGYVFYGVNHAQAMKAIFDFRFTDRDLVRLAEESGGRAFRISDLGDIVRIAREIYDRETNTYLASIRIEGKLLLTDRARFKVKSRRKDLFVDVVAVR